ncbi:uncharacterized protein LOC101856393 [Aplysia californica]|uniref:Uncharacterized protein LOC101856393 n=1 Tax=Aplysia californica TaxID=6500 RepID=A0ABM1A7B6_APLCA|nr:uncharacterized protein LOC101856393 [Aplysia californica]
MKPKLLEEKSTKWQRLVSRMKGLVCRLPADRRGRYSLVGPSSDDSSSRDCSCCDICDEVALNTSSNRNSEEVGAAGGGCGQRPRGHVNTFLDVLDSEGLLEFCDPISRRAVLSIGFGFSNSELLALSSRFVDEQRYQESLAQLDTPRQAQYERVFSQQYPLEPLVDGLPETVWLAWLEPSLSVLAHLNAIKRRKSNLSRRKSAMITMDSTSACHGDCEITPFLFRPDLPHGRQLRLMRDQFLALEALLDGHVRRRTGTIQRAPLHEVQAGSHPRFSAPNPDTRHRRRLRQFQPYPALQRDTLLSEYQRAVQALGHSD